MLHRPPGRVGGRGSDDDSPALREPDVVDAHRHGLVAERVREASAHNGHVQRINPGDAVPLYRAEVRHAPAVEARGSDAVEGRGVRRQRVEAAPARFCSAVSSADREGRPRFSPLTFLVVCCSMSSWAGNIWRMRLRARKSRKKPAIIGNGQSDRRRAMGRCVASHRWF